MNEIILSNGMVCKVSHEDFEELSKFKWHYSGGKRTGYAYRAVKSGGKQTNTLMHRQICKAPAGMVVDHINGNGLDNRRENLRIVTQKENSQNVAKFENKTSLFKGVSFHTCKGKYRAVIKVDGKSKHLGYFSDPESAAACYDIHARKAFGETGVYNFPNMNEQHALRTI